MPPFLIFAFFAQKQELNTKGISVVIPNYNGIMLLPEIIPTVFLALKATGLLYEIIVSDDNSSDNSVPFLRSNYPDIEVIANSKNKGFSPTINKGIFAAKYDYVLLLNSDVKLEENYFGPLLRYFEREDTFGVMGRIIGWHDDTLQDTAKFPSYNGAKIKTTGNYYSVTPSKTDWLYSMYLSGANAFVDRKKLLTLEGFDEIFAPFYVEDFELSLRAWRLGWKCYYEHFSICRHQVSVSIKSKSSKNYINAIYYRNKMYLHAMHLSGLPLLLWYLQQVPETLIRVFTFRFYYLTSLKLFFQSRKKISNSKSKFKMVAKTSDQLLSVHEVINTIKHNINKTEIKRF